MLFWPIVGPPGLVANRRRKTRNIHKSERFVCRRFRAIRSELALVHSKCIYSALECGWELEKSLISYGEFFRVHL